MVACRAGAMLASTDTLRATIVGRGGHAAMPHDALDPVPVAAEIILALQSEVARRTPVTDPIVLSITKISAGTTHNVLPDRVDLLGTLRTLSPEARARGRAAFERICTHVAAAHGCTAEVAIEPGYPPTVNDPRAVALVRATRRRGLRRTARARTWAARISATCSKACPARWPSSASPRRASDAGDARPAPQSAHDDRRRRAGRAASRCTAPSRRASSRRAG